MSQATRAKLPLRKTRSRAKEGPAFVFVDTTGATSTGSEKNDTKTIVRRQAARSGRTNHHDKSANQKKTDRLPDSLELVSAIRDAVGVASRAEDRYGTRKANTRPSLESVPQLLSSGYETFRLSYNFDITDLSSFTDVDLATNAYRLRRDESNRFTSLLQKQYSSFLAYLPSRYGSNTCLDNAMHCVAARAGQMLGFPMPKSLPFTLYGKALNSLRSAIADGMQCTVSDIYCVTRLMVLYEVSHIHVQSRNGFNITLD
jgi:hypothetical protein